MPVFDIPGDRPKVRIIKNKEGKEIEKVIDIPDKGPPDEYIPNKDVLKVIMYLRNQVNEHEDVYYNHRIYNIAKYLHKSIPDTEDLLNRMQHLWIVNTDHDSDFHEHHHSSNAYKYPTLYYLNDCTSDDKEYVQFFTKLIAVGFKMKYSWLRWVEQFGHYGTPVMYKRGDKMEIQLIGTIAESLGEERTG